HVVPGGPRTDSAPGPARERSPTSPPRLRHAVGGALAGSRDLGAGPGAPAPQPPVAGRRAGPHPAPGRETGRRPGGAGRGDDRPETGAAAASGRPPAHPSHTG